MALKTGGKAILVIKWQRTGLCPGVLWEVEPPKDDVGYLAKDPSKQRVEAATPFLTRACGRTLQGELN